MIYKPLIKYNAFLEKLHSFFNSYLDADFMAACVIKQDGAGMYWIGFSSIAGKSVYFRFPIRVESDFNEEYQISLKEFFTACNTVSFLEVEKNENKN